MFNRQAILDWLREQGRSRSFLAKQANVSYPQMLRITRGKCQPSLDTAARIAQALGRDIGELLADC